MLGLYPLAGASIAGSGAPAVPFFIAAVTGFGLTIGGGSVTTSHSATALVPGIEITAEINDTAVYSFMDADAPVTTAGLVTLTTIPGPIGTILGKYYNPPSLPIAVSLGTLNLAGYDYVEQATGFDLTLDVGEVYSASVFAAILDNHSQLATLSLGTAAGTVAKQVNVTGNALIISGPTANAVATGNGVFQTEALAEIAVELGDLENTNVITAITGFDVGNAELGILANTSASSQITASFLIGTVSTNTGWTLNNSHPDIEVSLLATLSVGELANQSTSTSLTGQSFALGFTGAVNNSSVVNVPVLQFSASVGQVTTQSINRVPVALPALAVTANLAGTDIFAVEFVTGSANLVVTASADIKVTKTAAATGATSVTASASFGVIRDGIVASQIAISDNVALQRVRPASGDASAGITEVANVSRVRRADADAATSISAAAAAVRYRNGSAFITTGATVAAEGAVYWSAAADIATTCSVEIIGGLLLSAEAVADPASATDITGKILWETATAPAPDPWSFAVRVSDADIWAPQSGGNVETPADIWQTAA